MLEDTQTRISIEQAHTVASDFLAEYKKGLKRTGVLRDTEADETKADSDSLSGEKKPRVPSH